MAIETSRRGFLRMLGVATAAGAAAPVIDKLDFMVRQPHSTSGNIVIQLGDWWVDVDGKLKTIGIGGHPPAGGITLREFYSALVDRMDCFEMMSFPNPMRAVTPNTFTLENDYEVDVSSLRRLKEGSLMHGDNLYQSVQVPARMSYGWGLIPRRTA